METKEQKIRKLRKIIEKKEYIDVLEKEKAYIKSGLAEYDIQQKINKAEQQLKELEEGNGTQTKQSQRHTTKF